MISFVVVLVTAAVPAQNVAPTVAQDVAPADAAPVDQVLTLDNVIQRAFAEAPAVASAEANAQVAKARVEIAQAAGLPSLAGVVNGSGQVTNGNFLCCAPQQSTAGGNNVVAGFAKASGYLGVTTTESVNAGLQANWLLLDFGRTSQNVRSAELSSNASLADLETARTQAAAQAGIAFLSLAGDQQLVESRQKLVTENERLLEVAHGKVQAGTSAPIEEVRAKVTVETAKVDVLTAQAAMKNDAASLAIALGIDPNRPITIAQPGAIDVVDDPVKAADDAEHTRPEIAAARLRVQAAEAALASARAGHLPALSATASAVAGPRYTTVSGAAVSETGSLGASFTIPIFDPGVNAEVAAAEASLLVAQASLRQQTVDIRGAAAQAAIAVRSTTASVGAADELLKEADENFREAQGRYELGAASLLELTDAEAQESAATLSVIQARVQSEAARLRLMAAIGTLHPSSSTPR